MGLNRYYVLSNNTNRYFGRSALEQLKLIIDRATADAIGTTVRSQWAGLKVTEQAKGHKTQMRSYWKFLRANFAPRVLGITLTEFISRRGIKNLRKTDYMAYMRSTGRY